MNRNKSNAAILTFAGTLLLTAAAAAQEPTKFTFDIQGGFTQTAGRSSRQVDPGFNAGIGAGYNFGSHLAAVVHVDYNQNGINSGTLGSLGFPGGDVHVWSFSLDPVIHLPKRGPVDAYITGGGGLYHYKQEFTAPTIAAVTGFNPFFGFYQVGVPATQVLQSYTVNRPGFDVGAGVGLGSKWHGKFYAEARWRRILFENNHYDMIPVSFGFRW